jgi:outer membrane protein insertion porin family
LYAGVAVPYGNSDHVPFIRQFFSGGPNSVRAFRVRSLGPGTFQEPDSITADFFDEQGGDIKLETNVEYRFPIYSIFKGALFADAGNNWVLKSDTLIPGGNFHWSRFMKELGAGVGLGLRVDANFFVLRVDLAMPVRKPWLPENVAA